MTNWLDQAFPRGYNLLQINGVPVPPETIINFLTGATATDDPQNKRTSVSISGATTPTGSGFIHVTSGVQDSTARAVNLASGDVTGAVAFVNLPQSVLGAVVGQFHIARACGTSNISNSGTQIIDGVNLGVGDRVLLTAQSTASQNGVWIVQSGTWSRPLDWNSASGSPPVQGNYISVSEGTSNANTLWRVTTAQTITVDTTSVTITQFTGGSSVTWATDLAGSTNTSQIVVGLTGASNVTTIRSTSPTLQWVVGTASPTINQAGLASDVAATNMTIAAQAAWASATTNVTGGNLILQGGQGKANANSGYVSLQAGTGVEVLRCTADGGSTLKQSAGYYALGGTVASTGGLRAANATAVVVARNAANSADLDLISTDASNNLYVGGSSSQTLEPVNTFVQATTGVNLVVSSTTVLGLSSTFATYSVPINMQSNYVEFGTNPAGSGNLRTANATTILAARNAANSADLSLVSTDASNNAYFGGSSAQSLEASNTYVQAAAGVNCVVGAVVIGGYAAGLGWLASGNNFSVGSQTPTMNSATNTAFFANASVATASPTSGIYLYANSGAFEFQTGSGRLVNFQA